MDKLWSGRDSLGRKIIEYDEYQKLQQRIKQLEDDKKKAINIAHNLFHHFPELPDNDYSDHITKIIENLKEKLRALENK